MNAHASALLLIPALLACAFSVFVGTANAAVVYSQPSGTFATSTTLDNSPSVRFLSEQFIATAAQQVGGGTFNFYMRADSGTAYVSIEIYNVTDAVIIASKNVVVGATSTYTTTEVETLNQGGTTIIGKTYQVRFATQTGVEYLVHSLQDSEGNLLINLFDTEGGFAPPNWGAITVSPPLDWEALQFVSTSTSLFSDADASSTLAAITESCAESGNLFARGLCWAFSYLFVPNPTTMNNFAELPTLMQTKFPFSWIADVNSAITGQVASSTQNAPSYTINLADLQIGSTTSMGNLLPNFTAFSSTTVLSYIPAPLWAAGQSLIGAGLWLALGLDIYATIRRRHAHV